MIMTNENQWTCLNDEEHQEAEKLRGDIKVINIFLGDVTVDELALDLFLRGWHQ